MKKKSHLSYTGNPKHMADHVEPDDGYETPMRKKPKKGSEKPDHPNKFSEPQTVGKKKMSRGESTYHYFKSKGFKTDLVDHGDDGAKPSKNKFRG